MREIKFRAWSVDYKKMLPVHDAKFVNGRMIGAKGVGWDDTVDVMQYTGLKDKNGKEIYEGDVLLIPDEVIAEYIGGHARYEPEPRIEAVQWDEKHGMWITKSDALCEQVDECEVIGNIYENPDLLTPMS